MEPEVKNVRQCTMCGGSADKYPHHIECRECGAVADLMTGIFNIPQQMPIVPGDTDEVH